jgi:ParB/RepB/Spo0J family partition protein
MDLREVNPDELKISDLNERRSNVGTSDLEENVNEHGVIQPPIVRRGGDDDHYEVVVGQRRTLAAQAVGLDTIPVIVTDWDDYEALAASISENLETMREDVSIKDRAKAIYRMCVLADDPDAFTDEGVPSATWVADKLGENRKTVVNWIEVLRPEWEGTEIHANYVSEDTAGGRQSVDINKIGDTTLRDIRTTTGGGEEGVQFAKEVETGGYSRGDIREVKHQKNRGTDLETAKENVKKAKEGRSIQRTIRFSGKAANGLDIASKERGTSEEQIVREAVDYYLEAEGYYE